MILCQSYIWVMLQLMQCPLRNANVPSATYDLSKYFYWSDESFFSQIRDIKNKYETPGTISNHL